MVFHQQGEGEKRKERGKSGCPPWGFCVGSHLGRSRCILVQKVTALNGEADTRGSSMGLRWTQGLCNEGSADRPLSSKFRPPPPTLPGESGALALSTLSALSACPLVAEKMYTSAHHYAHWRRILRIPRRVPECLGCLCRYAALIYSSWSPEPGHPHKPCQPPIHFCCTPHLTPLVKGSSPQRPRHRGLSAPLPPSPPPRHSCHLEFPSHCLQNNSCCVSCHSAVYSSLQGTKTLAQVHRAGFFPRDGLLPRLPSPPNLRVAPAMSAWTGLFGKMWWSSGSSLGKSCFTKNKSLWFGAVSHGQPWPCLSGEAEAAMYGPCPPTSPVKSELFARTAWVIKLSTFLRRWIVFPCYYFAFVLCSTWFHFKNPNKSLMDGARVG